MQGIFGGFKPDYILIDEAGHADEPETLLALTHHWQKDKSHVVLCGDPYQLGPLIRSTTALQHGLGHSLLERLMNMPPYMPESAAAAPGALVYNANYVVKLVRNYRSHPSLLTVPSRLFYNNELQPHAEERDTMVFVGWDALPNKQLPLIFDGVEGRHAQEGDSPSFYNGEEIVAVRKWITRILDCHGTGITASDIGVISPYARQCQKIRHALSAHGLSTVTVGSVETFQGSERKVIIVSTVRGRDAADLSSARQGSLAALDMTDVLGFDVHHNIGFVAHPKRFNVAITRAKALLIVVGSPTVLASDEHWGHLLRYCRDNTCCVGVPVPDPDADARRFEDMMAALSLDQGSAADTVGYDTAADSDEENDVVNSAAELPWMREDE